MLNRPLRSFGRLKSRRLRDRPQALINEVLPKITFKQAPADKEIWLEIGFGGGEHLAHRAKENTEIQYIGFEPFINGTAKLLHEVAEHNLKNILVYNGDVRDVLPSLPENSVSKVFILFPDPWPKKKHNKRRLIQKPLLDMLFNALKDGALVQVATDHHGYAKWILEAFLNHPNYEWLANSRSDWETEFEGHIKTKYQQKNMAKTSRAIFFTFKVNKKLVTRE